MTVVQFNVLLMMFRYYIIQVTVVLIKIKQTVRHIKNQKIAMEGPMKVELGIDQRLSINGTVLHSNLSLS